MTRQTYERATRLTKLATAHISKGDAADCKATGVGIQEIVPTLHGNARREQTVACPAACCHPTHMVIWYEPAYLYSPVQQS